MTSEQKFMRTYVLYLLQIHTLMRRFGKSGWCMLMRVVYCAAGGDVKDRVSDLDFLTATMALRRAPILSQLSSAGATPATFPAAAAYGLLAAGDKSVYSLYSSLLRLQPAAIALNPAAAVAAAAAAMVRPPTLTVYPSPPTAGVQSPTTAVYTATCKTTDSGDARPNVGDSPSVASGNNPCSTLVNGAHRYRPYMSPSSLATVAKRLDTSTVRQSNWVK